MIIDLIFGVVAGVLNIVLAPFEIVNIGIDIVSSIPVVEDFVRVVAYLLPFSNLLPIIIISFSILFLRICIGVWHAVLNLIPVLR